jgi:hypothetical protein
MAPPLPAELWPVIGALKKSVLRLNDRLPLPDQDSCPPAG